MLSKRIFWTLLITAMLVIASTVTQAQSRAWPRGGKVNTPAPEQTVEREPEPALQEAQTDEHCDLKCLKEKQKTAIVGSWLGTAASGNKLLNSFTSDGLAFASFQGQVSSDPELGVVTGGHGVWKHLGGRTFGLTDWFINYDLHTGELFGYIKTQLLLTLNHAGDEMSSMDKIQILDPDFKVVATFTDQSHHKRIKVEPFN